MNIEYFIWSVFTYKLSEGFMNNHNDQKQADCPVKPIGDRKTAFDWTVQLLLIYVLIFLDLYHCLLQL